MIILLSIICDDSIFGHSRYVKCMAGVKKYLNGLCLFRELYGKTNVIKMIFIIVRTCA